MGNESFTVCQFGFPPVDSCTSQLLSKIHEIEKNLISLIDVRGVFLDISREFAKFDIKDLSINFNCMEFPAIFLNVLKIT